MSEEARWAVGIAVLAFLSIVGWLIAHTQECKVWRASIMEKIGKLEGK